MTDFLKVPQDSSLSPIQTHAERMRKRSHPRFVWTPHAYTWLLKRSTNIVQGTIQHGKGRVLAKYCYWSWLWFGGYTLVEKDVPD